MDENTGKPQWQTDTQQGSFASPTAATAPAIPAVTWTASEFISHQKGPTWYLTFGVIAGVITFLVVLVTGSIASGFVVAMACIALGVIAARQPATRTYEINEDGVVVDNRPYSYAMFKSFSIVEEEAVSSIWLRPLRRYTPNMVMYFAREDEEKITGTLENFLPEEHQQLDVFERLSRRFRF